MQERRFELKDNEVPGYYMETTKMCASKGPVYPVSFASVLGVNKQHNKQLPDLVFPGRRPGR